MLYIGRQIDNGRWIQVPGRQIYSRYPDIGCTRYPDVGYRYPGYTKYPDVGYRYPDIRYRYPDVGYRYLNVGYIGVQMSDIKSRPISLDIGYDIIAPVSFCRKWYPILRGGGGEARGGEGRNGSQ